MSKYLDNRLMRKYLSKEDIKIMKDLQLAVKVDQIVVTCMGLYNHGKSSLLNALIGDLDNLTFKTADTRETTSKKTEVYNNLAFVDTPGLNAQKHDDKRVMDATKESDINLFVHNVNTGEFVGSEVEFFHRIKKHWKNPQEFLDRTIFVLSRIDEVNCFEDVRLTELKMKQQLIDIFECDSIIVPVSSKDYLDGVINQEDELIKQSNMASLEKILYQFQSEFTEEIKCTKKERLRRYSENLISKLTNRLNQEQLELWRLQNEQRKVEESLRKDLLKISRTLKSKRSEIYEF